MVQLGEKAALDFLASVTILQANLRLFHDGVRDTYRVAATELRKLLCDGRSTLLPRVFVDPRLHKLDWTHVLERTPSLAEKLQILLPGELEVKHGQPRFRLLFAATREVMPLDPWLDQVFLGPDTVREFIRSVANKEGAHADPKYNDTLTRAKSVRYVADESHLHCVVGIAEYLLNFLRLEKLEVAPGVPIRRGPSGEWERV